MCLPLKPFKIEREWKHAGLSCAVVMAREAQHRCGYVRVPPTHPMHGKSYDEADVAVHGGLTFAQIEPCQEHEDGQGWWFGFDCAHWDDAMYDPHPNLAQLSPDAREFIDISERIRKKVRAQMNSVFGSTFDPHANEHYWTQAEVERECERLADQLAERTTRR
jgi:hypothetical protein